MHTVSKHAAGVENVLHYLKEKEGIRVKTDMFESTKLLSNIVWSNQNQTVPK